MHERKVLRVLTGQPSSDGDGVRLLRVFSPDAGLDPFLLLDEFGSDEAADYIGGFPSHPHRGFETVTYMLEGRMRHGDHLGNSGLLVSGGVQWMTAGRGIIHSEMPEQVEGRMRGFQLWLNLPAAEKMKPASYRDIEPAELPLARWSGAAAKVIAGRVEHDGGVTEGAVRGVSTDPLYLDIAVPANGELIVPVSGDRTALVYLYEGGARIAGERIERGQLAVLGEGEAVSIAAGETEARLLLLAATPLREPVVHYGPFVMNSVAEIVQALADFRAGRLAG